MAENSKIEWTDHTFNHVIGCQKVAQGCNACYAAGFAKRYNKAVWGPQGTRVKTSDANWRKPLKWNREAEAVGERRRVFCASLADVFESWDGPIHDHKGEKLMRYCNSSGEYYLPDSAEHRGGLERDVTMDDIRRDLFKLIDATPWLDWLLLTKRPENIRRMWPRDCLDGDFATGESRLVHRRRENCWLGTSIATQEDADRNIPLLLQCRDLAPVLFVSAEPLVGPVSFTLRGLPGWDEDWKLNALTGKEWASPRDDEEPEPGAAHVDWVIVGGESGHGARPMHPDWARSLRDQCTAAGVAYFFKQWGNWKPFSEMTEDESESLYKSNRIARDGQRQCDLDEVYGRRCTVETRSIQFDGQTGHRCDCVPGSQVPAYQVFNVGKKSAGRLLDGREWNEIPIRKATEAAR